MPRKGGSVSIMQQKNEKLIQHSTSGKMSICIQCGKPFAQTWRPEYEAYTSFKTCPSCRMTNARGGINVGVDYTPHPGQELIHNSKARFKVINAGIRWGKDRCSIMEGIRYFIECLNEERDGSMVPHALMWIIAPTEKVANQNWRELMHTVPKEIVVDVSKTTRTIETINGGIIEVHSAYDPESLVGVGLDVVLITEAARIADLEDVWSNLEGRLNSPGRGVGGKGGIAIINSSPLGMNYFYKMWKWGQNGTSEWDPDWESWTFTTWDNPYMAVRGNQMTKNGRTYRENLERRMSRNRYKQDYLAEFLCDINSVFPNYERVLVKPPVDCVSDEQINAFWQEWERPEPFEIYTMGYDPASKGDGKPVVVHNSTGKVVKVDPMMSLGWDAQWDRVAYYSRLYNGAVCHFGQTGVGETISSQLTKRGVTNVPIPEQGRNKEKLVEDFAIIVEQQYCKIPWSQETENQLKGYISVNRSGQSTQYHNGEDSDFDDIISALYFSFSGYEAIVETLPWCGLISGVKKVC
ncbi:MAG: hypothetical protein WC373_05610 [Smithella sp.]